MSVEIPVELPQSEPGHARPAWLRALVGGENLLVVLPLAALVVLPLAEIVLRALFRTGISGSSTIVQHMCLFVGMFGGAIAARENRLLSLSTITSFLNGRRWWCWPSPSCWAPPCSPPWAAPPSSCSGDRVSPPSPSR